MIERASRRVLTRGAGSHEKRPIARLREQKFACELFENAIGKCVCVLLMDSCEFTHAQRGGVQVRVNPRVVLVDPNFEMTFVAPARSGRFDRLLRRVRCEIISWRG